MFALGPDVRNVFSGQHCRIITKHLHRTAVVTLKDFRATGRLCRGAEGQPFHTSGYTSFFFLNNYILFGKIKMSFIVCSKIGSVCRISLVRCFLTKFGKFDMEHTV